MNGHREKRYFIRSLWRVLVQKEVLKIMITLSHDQALVERDFSANKSLLVKNLGTQSLIAQRIVYDHMKVKNINAKDM